MLVLILIFIIQIVTKVSSEYVVPKAHLRVLEPKGFRVSIPNEEGVQLFAFHGNINQPLNDSEAGRFSKDILQPVRGRWIFEDKQTKLKKGDVIYYWLFVIKDHLGYRSKIQEFSIKADEDITTKSPEASQESNFHASLGQQFHPDKDSDSSYKIALKVSNIAAELYEEVKKLREINSILSELVSKDEMQSKTLRFEGVLPGFDDAVYNAQIIIREKLGLTVPVVDATKNANNSITFSVASLEDKIFVIRTAKKILVGSKIKLSY